MTKTIIIGTGNVKRGNPIKFIKCFNTDYVAIPTSICPKDYKYIELITYNYTTGLDLMFAYDDPNARNKGILYIGQWGDGIIE